MLASTPASILNGNPSSLGIPLDSLSPNFALVFRQLGPPAAEEPIELRQHVHLRAVRFDVLTTKCRQLPSG
jgi:hypothetical protein